MRVAVPHSLPREEVRRRMRERADEIGSLFPAGMAEVRPSWTNEDRLDLAVSAMGKAIAVAIEIEDAALAFEIELPAALSFVEPMIRGAIEEKGRKLLT